jgi:hypothetical protein
MRRYRPEDQIQRAVVQHYRARAAPGVFMFAVPNGGARSKIEAAIMKSTGTTAGVPDTIRIKGGQVYALEIKAEDGRASRAQLDPRRSASGAGNHQGSAASRAKARAPQNSAAKTKSRGRCRPA